MEATIVNFRTARHHQKDSHMILQVSGVDTRDKAQKLVGKQVTWTTPGKKEIKGKVAAAHGNKGAVRAIFEKGMPGQSKGTTVKIA